MAQIKTPETCSW